MARVVVDANVVIAFLDSVNAHHVRAVGALRPWLDRAGDVAITSVTYAEVLVGAVRAGQESVVEAFVDGIAAHVVPVDRALARDAARLRADRAELRLPDALPLAVAARDGLPLLTFDERLRRTAAAAGVALAPASA